MLYSHPGMQNGDKHLTSIFIAGQGHLVWYNVYFNLILLTNTFQHYQYTGMQNGD